MFDRAVDFDQDISSWCVNQIPNEPNVFDQFADIEGKPQKQPNWGTNTGC
jgi:hypothetical protein